MYSLSIILVNSLLVRSVKIDAYFYDWTLLPLNLTVVVVVAGMDAFLNEFTLQLKSNALVVTLLFGCFGCFFYANRETNRKIDGMGLKIHLIEKQLPESIVHIVLTPSQASRTKDANLKILLDLLLIDFLIMSDCAVKPSKKTFRNANLLGTGEINRNRAYTSP